jgi:hypothetical protein
MFRSQLSAQPNSRLEPLDRERHESPAPDRSLGWATAGPFQTIETKELEGSDRLNHQEFLY